MQYDKLLHLALVPSIVFFLLSLVSVALTTHYWILGDWIVPRDLRVTTDQFNERTQSFRYDDTIVYYVDRETDSTVAAGCLCFGAAIAGMIAWCTLRKPGMDTQLASGKRRFWVLAVIVMSTAGAAAALASLVLHYTEQGSDADGCSSRTWAVSGGKTNTNKYCTREMGSCNLLPMHLRGADRYNASVACNETVVVKWIQLILLLLALIQLAMFSFQARMRRTTRASRMLEPVPKAG
ncbi:hypothetical protein HBH98_228690 [Parastagonospora nodorum]|nr:hypothetical protein HBH51_222450 [Parastagonospora nodorum]KAH3989001.1 hypothetical protein HBH52_021680 [Parastagonospora nodorum]KAH4013043.1 hypothetical protein HBI09_218640 [Parastagonospora nodorum]KAH4181542.1 hypothetical protein HBH42_234190 [Parastagonospora nodorum]KAH4189477.1 hypothetical protein HBI95_222630 [Parastagonospora nodorum]